MLNQQCINPLHKNQQTDLSCSCTSIWIMCNHSGILNMKNWPRFQHSSHWKSIWFGHEKLTAVSTLLPLKKHLIWPAIMLQWVVHRLHEGTTSSEGIDTLALNIRNRGNSFKPIVGFPVCEDLQIRQTWKYGCRLSMSPVVSIQGRHALCFMPWKTKSDNWQCLL